MLFGCVGRIVMAAILLIAGAVLWHFRAMWMPKAKAFFREKASEIEVEVPRVTGLPAGYTIRYITPEIA
jgi:hypothetical protein